MREKHSMVNFVFLVTVARANVKLWQFKVKASTGYNPMISMNCYSESATPTVIQADFKLRPDN